MKKRLPVVFLSNAECIQGSGNLLLHLTHVLIERDEAKKIIRVLFIFRSCTKKSSHKPQYLDVCIYCYICRLWSKMCCSYASLEFLVMSKNVLCGCTQLSICYENVSAEQHTSYLALIFWLFVCQNVSEGVGS